MSRHLEELVRISRYYGSNPEYVLAGGGNTSMKEDGVLYVKASGALLSVIDESGFVGMDIASLGRMRDTKYSSDPEARESEVLCGLMSARIEGETGRPSVEALLHSMLENKFVVHTHPSFVNGLTCGRSGAEYAERIFGARVLWVPSVNPGYMLASEVGMRLEKAERNGGGQPRIMLLQNHGLFVAGESADEVLSLYDDVFSRISAFSGFRSVPPAPIVRAELEAEAGFRLKAEEMSGKKVCVRTAADKDTICLAESEDSFRSVCRPFTPDQIVYSGPGPAYARTMMDIPKVAEDYRRRWKLLPRAMFVRGYGLFCTGETETKAEYALMLMKDAVNIAVYSSAFGGPLPMTEAQTRFILDWEAERFRASAAGAGQHRC